MLRTISSAKSFTKSHDVHGIQFINVPYKSLVLPHNGLYSPRRLVSLLEDTINVHPHLEFGPIVEMCSGLIRQPFLSIRNVYDVKLTYSTVIKTYIHHWHDSRYTESRTPTDDIATAGKFLPPSQAYTHRNSQVLVRTRAWERG